jgi:3-oxoacyl-[acyl-carrier protein] reductase
VEPTPINETSLEGSGSGPEAGLAGRRALITGASSGIGAATARRFVAEGASVALLARRRAELDELASELGAATITVDVRDSTQVARAVGAAHDALKGLDVAVNCAGVARQTPLAETDDASWEEMINVNLRGTFFVCREAGPRMAREDGGAIVNLGSDLSVVGLGNWAPYCAAKFGILGLTKSLAAELAPKVTVNAVCPGPVDTPMLAGLLAANPDPDAAMEQTIGRVPLHRVAQPEEVASAILFLVNGGRFATGSALMLDGGSTAV